jgi:hypothetical protein
MNKTETGIISGVAEWAASGNKPNAKIINANISTKRNNLFTNKSASGL